MKFNTKRSIQVLAILIHLPWNVLTAQLIPADHLPPPGIWESAGVEGGIPNRTTIFADITQPPYNADKTGVIGASAAIQRAIDDCPTNQVVYAPEGTYNIDVRLRLRKSITIRGAGSSTVFVPTTSSAFLIGGLGPWPAPKNNPPYFMDVTGVTRGSTSVTVTNASSIEVGKMILIDEEDDPTLVWTKSGFVGRFRGSMHLVESKAGNTVTFRPPLPITYSRNPHLSRYPDIVQYAGIENIKFQGSGTSPGVFISITSVWNVWVTGCEFSNMPSKTIVVNYAGHVELRKNYMHDQSNGGPNSEGFDFLADVNWSSVVDNICVAGGNPQITIGDGGASPNYSGGFGNVIAYNYAVDAFYTDPPTSTNHGMMSKDISVNHSPHSQYNLVEGNYMSKFGADSYHGSGSHAVVLRNVITGRNRWTFATHRNAMQIDRRNLFFSIVGNVLGEVGSPMTYEYVTNSAWSGSSSAIFRLGYPNTGNQGFTGTYPPTDLLHGDGGPRDLYVDRNNTTYGTTLIEGNWNSKIGMLDWTIAPTTVPNSLYLSSKPSWFGNLKWPPVDPANPVTNDPTIIPAGYRYIHGVEPPSDETSLIITDQRFIAPDAFQVQWDSVAGKMYEMQVSTNLIDWGIVTNLTATSTNTIWTDVPVMGTKKFYRVRLP